MTEEVGISFNRFTDSSLNIQVVQWWKSTAGKEQGASVERMNLAIKERFDAEGIEFAFPTRTVYLKSDADVSKPQTKPD
jgi:MscS family membrane protein